MHPQASAVLNGLTILGANLYILVGTVAAIIVWSMLSKRSNLDAIPTVGPTSHLGSWWNGGMYQGNHIKFIQQGYEKYTSAPFKVSAGRHWMVVLGSRQHMEEIQKAPEDVLSFSKAFDNNGTMKYIHGMKVDDPSSYAHNVLASYLARDFVGIYSDIRDEIRASFDEVLSLRDHEWKSVSILSPIQKVVSRTSNRIFVGLPLCRDPDWIDLNVRYTLDVKMAECLLGCFPYYLAPIIVHFTKVRENIKQGTKLLGPIIEERLKDLEEHGKRSWKPNVLLSHLIDTFPEGPEYTVQALTRLIMIINTAAVHTTSLSFFHALLLLAENPQYIKPLREEVDSILEKEGWSKAALGKMRKIDSFLKESFRLKGVTPVTLLRKTLKDITLTDGTYIPKGMVTAAPTRWLHLENKHYRHAHVFDPFRFSNMCDEDGESAKHHFVSTSLEYLPFGHGKHACPGRFFAATMLKTMLAHVIVSYDLKLDHDEHRADAPDLGPECLSKVMFRKRVNNVD